MGASLKQALHENNPDKRLLTIKNGTKFLAVFIEIDTSYSRALLTKYGCNIRTLAGNIATADIPYDNIVSIAALPAIKKIELPLLFRKTDTAMKKYTGVFPVHNAESPLTRAYKGKGTVIGIIDDGIDVSHPDFYDTSGHIRVKYLWNMDGDYRLNKVPVSFDYGAEWPADSLEKYALYFKQQRRTRYEMQQLFGFSFHGTPVTSIAAGKNGVAPEADIVSVALTAFGDTILRSDRLIDGIRYIHSIAVRENKKCIINISLGLMDGAPHDGKTMVEKAIDNYCYENPNVLVCVSAGNNGNTWKHWGTDAVHSDSSFGFFKCSYRASMYFAIPKQYSKTLRISVGDAKYGGQYEPYISPDSMYYQSPFVTIDSLINSSYPITFVSYTPDGRLSSNITLTAAHANDDYDELILTTDEKTSTPANMFDEHLYRFIFKGTGSVHGWFPFFNLHPIYYFGDNPYPDDPTYVNTDNDYTTIIPTHAYTVISSGAYNIRNCYVNKLQNKVVASYEHCRTTYFTSRGPTADGRIKPDILTPGENVIAASSLYNDFYGHDFFIDSSTISFGGTSASSPITAGIAALVWEKYPDLLRNDIIEKIKSTAYFDGYCSNWGSQPNNITGWGKADAFKALGGEHISVSELCNTPDECSIIENPGTEDTPVTTNMFIIYPNPVQDVATIKYRSNWPLTLIMYDALGKAVFRQTIPASLGERTMQIRLRSLAAGIYFAQITGWQKPVTIKLVKITG